MVNITFPKLRDDWSLDVVNILAFLGEHNILACSQQICMSWTCFLPRLIPAPQGLLAQRPKKLASEDDVTVNGVFSDDKRPSLIYFGRMMHTDGSELKDFTTRVFKIKWKNENNLGSSQRSPIRPRFLSPMNLIAFLSCATSFGLAAWACVLGDAVALTGILVMSFTTPLLCVGMRWTPRKIPTYIRHTSAPIPPGMVVIKSPNNCFTIVECDERIARLLYFHPEHINYAVSSFSGRGLSGTVGGLTLVGSIVLFGNAVWTMKAALAVTYTLLNLLYWIAAILPVRLSWHIDLVVTQEAEFYSDTFTTCLWKTIHRTKSTNWAADHVPNNNIWNEWLHTAKVAAQDATKPEDWDPTNFLQKLFRQQEYREAGHNFEEPH